MRPSYEVEDSLLRRICRLLVEIVTVIAFAWFIVYSFGTQVVNNGQSMRPTLEDGDRLLLDRFGFKLFGPRRFDIVLFKSDSGQTNIKRIVALPGESVVIRDGKLYVNGKEYKEDDSMKAAFTPINGFLYAAVLLSLVFSLFALTKKR